jgi:hypothetical protein
MTVPATLIRTSTGEVLTRGLLPVDPSIPVPGLDPDLEWLIDYEEFAPPLYDGRVYALQTTMDATATPHPDWPLYNQYAITYDTVRRAVDDIKEEIINAERNEFGRHIDFAPKLAILGLAVAFRQMDGLQLSPIEQKVYDRVMANALKIFQNYQRRQQLENEAEQLQPLDIDAGWATPAPNDPV